MDVRDPGGRDLLLPLQVCQRAGPASLLLESSWGVECGEMSSFNSSSQCLRKCEETSIFADHWKPEADGSWRGEGSQGEALGDGTGMSSGLCHPTALAAHNSQMLTFISAFLWSTGPYYSCFAREENGSREDKEFIHFPGQGHIR